MSVEGGVAEPVVDSDALAPTVTDAVEEGDAAAEELGLELQLPLDVLLYDRLRV